MCRKTFHIPTCGCPPYPVHPYTIICPAAHARAETKTITSPSTGETVSYALPVPCTTHKYGYKKIGKPCLMCRELAWHDSVADRKETKRQGKLLTYEMARASEGASAPNPEPLMLDGDAKKLRYLVKNWESRKADDLRGDEGEMRRLEAECGSDVDGDGDTNMGDMDERPPVETKKEKAGRKRASSMPGGLVGFMR